MGEIENLKIEIINLKQLLVGYQECMQKCTYFQNMALSFQLHLKTCQGELRVSQTQLRAAQISAKAFESKYNAALEIAGVKMSNSTPETETTCTKKRKLDAPSPRVQQEDVVAVIVAKDTGKPHTPPTKVKPSNSEEVRVVPAEEKTDEPARIIAQEEPPTEKKKPAPPSFEERFAQLEHFHAGHGHCNVPRKGFKELNIWVNKMREKYSEKQRRGYHNYLTDERVAKLESLGFQWRIRTKAPIPFETRLAELRKFKQETGHCKVPRSHPLGEWVHCIRGEHRRKGGLEKARQKPLEDLGFVFESSRKGSSFEERVEQCAAWRRRHGHLKIPQLSKGKARLAQIETMTEEEMSLRRWATRVKEHYRCLQKGEKSSLDRIKVKKLDSMGFCWEYVPPEGTKAPPAPNTQTTSNQKEGPRLEDGTRNNVTDSDAEMFEMVENDCTL